MSWIQQLITAKKLFKFLYRFSCEAAEFLNEKSAVSRLNIVNRIGGAVGMAGVSFFSQMLSLQVTLFLLIFTGIVLKRLHIMKEDGQKSNH